MKKEHKALLTQVNEGEITKTQALDEAGYTSWEEFIKATENDNNESETKPRKEAEIVLEVTDIVPHSKENVSLTYVFGETSEGDSIEISFGDQIVLRKAQTLQIGAIVRLIVEKAISGKTHWVDEYGELHPDKWSGYSGTFKMNRVSKRRWEQMCRLSSIKASANDDSFLEAVGKLTDAGANYNL